MKTITKEPTVGTGAETTTTSYCSATDASCFYTAKVDDSPSFSDGVALEESQTVGAGGATTSGRSEYYPARCEAMMRSRSKYPDEVEFEIEFSKPHWSELSHLAPLSEEEVKQYRENRQVFARLKNDPRCGKFFRDWVVSYKLGRRIAKGGQADIHEVVNEPSMLLKVFEKGSLLQLRQLWPLQVLKGLEVVQCIKGGELVEDGRFAFLMRRCRGDLRKLIDQAMEENNIHGNQGPPFPYKWEGMTIRAEDIMWNIAKQMEVLNRKGIFHRDLKASNILFQNLPRQLNEPLKYEDLLVADYECSIGVVGTGFWRAPEILLALKKREAIRDEQWEKADVYSYGMVCFEVLTGRLPFDGELQNTTPNRNRVIKGLRPKLPCDLDGGTKDLITKCWDSDPNLRPTFFEIQGLVKKMKQWQYLRLLCIRGELPPQHCLATLKEVNDYQMELFRVMPCGATTNLVDGSIVRSGSGGHIR